MRAGIPISLHCWRFPLAPHQCSVVPSSRWVTWHTPSLVLPEESWSVGVPWHLWFSWSLSWLLQGASSAAPFAAAPHHSARWFSSFSPPVPLSLPSTPRHSTLTPRLPPAVTFLSPRCLKEDFTGSGPGPPTCVGSPQSQKLTVKFRGEILSKDRSYTAGHQRKSTPRCTPRSKVASTRPRSLPAGMHVGTACYQLPASGRLQGLS